jgi:hypothetical protein
MLMGTDSDILTGVIDDDFRCAVSNPLCGERTTYGCRFGSLDL